MMNKTYTLLHVIRQGEIGGGESHLLDLVAGLSGKGHTSTILCFSDGPMVEEFRQMGIEVLVLSLRAPWDFSLKYRLKSFFSKHSFDLIHAHGSKAALNMLAVCRQRSIPLVYTVHGWSFHAGQNALNKSLRLWAEKNICQYAEATICVSHANAKEGGKILSSFDPVVIHNGISLAKFDYQISSEDVVKEIGANKNEIWVAHISRMTHQKNPLGMIKSFAHAYREESKLRLLMVGEGDLDFEVDREIQEQGLQKIILRLPFRKDIPEILSAVDMYCLPSFWEGFPIGLLEAMAMKKAIIASDVDGVKEALPEAKFGICIEPDNSKALTIAIIKLAKDELLRKKLGEMAYKRVKEHFTVEKMVEKSLKVYEKSLWQNKNHVADELAFEYSELMN